MLDLIVELIRSSARYWASVLLRVAEPRFQARHGCSGLIVLPLQAKTTSPYEEHDVIRSRSDSTQSPFVLLLLPGHAMAHQSELSQDQLVAKEYQCPPYENVRLQVIGE